MTEGARLATVVLLAASAVVLATSHESSLRAMQHADGKVWYYRADAPGSAGDGSSYDAAWRGQNKLKQAAIEWSRLQPGDTLYICGAGSGVLGEIVGLAGQPSAHITIDGSCPGRAATGGAAGAPPSSDPALWVGGVKLAFPSGWTGPDVDGIWARPDYHGCADFAIEADGDGRDAMRQRLGNIYPKGERVKDRDATCARDQSWSNGTACNVCANKTIYYKPALAHPRFLYMANLAVLKVTKCAYVTIRNLDLQGLAIQLISVEGSSHVDILNNTLRWAAFAGVALNDRQTASGGLNGGRIMHNVFKDTACGLYLCAKFGDQSSNDLLVANNTFEDIDPQNFYHNSDTHAIGVQGGQRNVYEHNHIDRVGGSGFTFFTWHNLSLSDTVVRYNTISNVYNHDQANFPKLQRGIEFDSGTVNASRCLNNTVSYNVLRNIGTVAFRSKATVPPLSSASGNEAADRASWRWINNVVINASVNFETRYSSGAVPVPHGDLVANNLFVQPTVHHQDGAMPAHSADDTDAFFNNAFWPDANGLFCYGGSDPPIDAKSWSTNCTTSFAAWASRFSASVVAAKTVVLVDPKFESDSSQMPLPNAARPSAGALAGAGRSFPYQVSFARTDIGGRPVKSPPSIGAFEL